MTFIHLAQTEEQWPVVGRGDMYYGGTTYENSQGLGVQLESLGFDADAGFDELNRHQALNRQMHEVAAPPGVSSDTSLVADVLIAVPITRLYDRGTIIARSATLASRLSAPSAVFHPNDAQRLKLSKGMAVSLRWNGSSAEATVDCEGTMPEGFVLVPRSLGIAISWPVAVEVTALQSTEVS